jgi:hypothetical protein
VISSYPVRVRIGVFCIIVFALLSSGNALRRALYPPPWTTAQDEISHYEARFRLLKSALPPRGVVGYLSEPWRPPLDVDWARGLYLTEYALAPLIVVDSTAPALVIGNFRSAGPDRNILDPTLVLVRDFGDGVLLFRHQPR